MSQNHREVNFFRRNYNKIKQYLLARNLERKLEQEYTQIMRKKNNSTYRKSYN